MEAALTEDLGADRQDLTTEAIVGSETAVAEIVANESGIVAGQEVAGTVFKCLLPEIGWRCSVTDGDRFAAGQAVARIEGPLSAILTGERTALNMLAHLSGIATLTGKYVQAVVGTDARIFDTRKTLPGLRYLEKAAVIAGGGNNHRFGLYDGVLIKDNHLIGRDLDGAIARARQAYPGRPIEVEVEEIDQLRQALSAEADIVLLDNMDLGTLREAISLAKGRAEIEVSGGINLDTVEAVARAGAERISVGALTQAATPIDFSLDVKEVH